MFNFSITSGATESVLIGNGYINYNVIQAVYVSSPIRSDGVWLALQVIDPEK